VKSLQKAKNTLLTQTKTITIITCPEFGAKTSLTNINTDKSTSRPSPLHPSSIPKHKIHQNFPKSFKLCKTTLLLQTHQTNQTSPPNLSNVSEQWQSVPQQRQLCRRDASRLPRASALRRRLLERGLRLRERRELGRKLLLRRLHLRSELDATGCDVMTGGWEVACTMTRCDGGSLLAMS